MWVAQVGLITLYPDIWSRERFHLGKVAQAHRGQALVRSWSLDVGADNLWGVETDAGRLIIELEAWLLEDPHGRPIPLLHLLPLSTSVSFILFSVFCHSLFFSLFFLLSFVTYLLSPSFSNNLSFWHLILSGELFFDSRTRTFQCVLLEPFLRFFTDQFGCLFGSLFICFCLSYWWQ